MVIEERIEHLSNTIKKNLGPIIDNDFVLLNIPLHVNIGDTLIFQGEKEFLESLPFRWLNRGYRYENYNLISDDTIILLHGGGNFGDVWRVHQDFRVSIINKYPNNKIIVLPQTVYYDDNELITKDSIEFSKHQNLYICARDDKSFEFLCSKFSNKILLVPDMAFCISNQTLSKFIKPIKKHTLFLKRTDKELEHDKYLIESKNEIEVHDWPSFEQDPKSWKNYVYLMKASRKFGKVKFMLLQRLFEQIADFYFFYFCRPDFVKIGVSFISQYQNIYTTRLHGAILSVLLGKEVYLFDNSYGKNKSYYDTWFKENKKIKLVK